MSHSAAPNRRCPRCGGSFRCGIDDRSRCACAAIELTASVLAALQTSHAGCLCPDCLRALARGEPIAIGAGAVDQPRPTKGMPVAITVIDSTLASSGKLAM